MPALLPHAHLSILTTPDGVVTNAASHCVARHGPCKTYRPMTGQIAKDFHPVALKLFDEYVQGRLSRREFLDRAGKFAVAVAAAETMLLALSPDFASAQQVAASDPRIAATYVQYPSPEGYGTLRGYLARPAEARGRLPTVLVVHENRGLNPHIEDIARRLALDDFIAFAPDALFPLGGYPGNEAEARDLFAKLDQSRTRADFLAAAAVLEKLPGGNGKVGVVGFGYGGDITNFLATRLPDLGAAVPFYGAQPSAADAARIKAPLLLHYAGIQHGFNNETTPRYDAPAAHLAWLRTVEFLDKHLRA